MLKNIIGSIVFTVAVFALVNFIGNVMVNPATAPHAPVVLKAEVSPAPAAVKKTPVKKAAPTAAPVPAPVQEQVAAMTGDAAGDVAAGKKTFRRKCMGCHTVDKGDPNRTGPNLWGIIDRKKAAAEGYRYSKSMRLKGGVWSAAELKAFIAGPRTFIRDTKMTFAGIKKESDRVNIIAYLETLKD